MAKRQKKMVLRLRRLGRKKLCCWLRLQNLWGMRAVTGNQLGLWTKRRTRQAQANAVILREVTNLLLVQLLLLRVGARQRWIGHQSCTEDLCKQWSNWGWRKPSHQGSWSSWVYNA
jgi:hypothetical protein